MLKIASEKGDLGKMCEEAKAKTAGQGNAGKPTN
jgi:hypothetical protein